VGHDYGGAETWWGRRAVERFVAAIEPPQVGGEGG